MTARHRGPNETEVSETTARDGDVKSSSRAVWFVATRGVAIGAVLECVRILCGAERAGFSTRERVLFAMLVEGPMWALGCYVQRAEHGKDRRER